MEKVPLSQKESGINRVVGFESETEEDILIYFKNAFETNSPDSVEKEKTSEQLELFNRVNIKMREFLAQYGVEALAVPAGNIHIPDRSKLTDEEFKQLQEKFRTESGFYSAPSQGIGIMKDYEVSKLSFLQTLVHEVLHLQGFYSYQKSDELNADVVLKRDGETASMNIRRSGFSIGTRDGKRLFFEMINESVITELEIRFEKEYLINWPELRGELEVRDEFVQHASEEAGKVVEVAGLANKSSVPVWVTYPYVKEREQFNILVNDLYERNKDDFENREQVFELFVRATLTGQLLPVARLVEKAYGKGAFRRMGEFSASESKEIK